MGLLVDGTWQDQWYDTKKSGGKFVRTNASFRNWITADGSAGPSGEGGFEAEAGRYHLYVSYACPWAHRTLIYRTLKGLDSMIDVSFVHWFMGENGWTFQADDKGIVGNKLFDSDYMYEVYLKADPKFTGRVTVPVLWDKQQQTIVSNESSEIIRMFNSAFDGVGAKAGDFYPAHLQTDIDALNDRIYNTVNNGVYKCGFATLQKSYDEAVQPLFETLEVLETQLTDQRFLYGAQPTEADWRLFPTLLRFDAIYVGHFKCNLKRLIDFPNLWSYARDLYQWPGIAETVHMDHAKDHYFQSHETINPTRIVPAGPIVDWELPHGRS